MKTYSVLCGDLWEGNPKKREYMYTYSSLTWLYSRNKYNIVKQLVINFFKCSFKNVSKLLLSQHVILEWLS